MTETVNTEALVATRTMRWLTEMGWDCYPEFQPPHGPGRADIAARKGPLLWIIEAKKTLSMDLMRQAVGWIDEAHFVSVAVPVVARVRRKRGEDPYQKHSQRQRKVSIDRFKAQILSHYGIGLIRMCPVTAPEPGREAVLFGPNAPDLDLEREETRPRFQKSRFVRRAAAKNIASLHEDMKRYTPGSTVSEGYSTPWRRTMDAAKRRIEQSPGLTMVDIMHDLNHHYSTQSSARSCLMQWLQADSAVRVDTSSKPYQFFIVENKA